MRNEIKNNSIPHFYFSQFQLTNNSNILSNNLNKSKHNSKMKFAAALALFATSANAFGSFGGAKKAAPVKAAPVSDFRNKFIYFQKNIMSILVMSHISDCIFFTGFLC